jgi:hypothetical protein
MLLENLDSVFDRARTNIWRYVDDFANALKNESDLPPFVGIRLPKQKAAPRRTAKHTNSLIDDCIRALAEVKTMEQMSRRGKGSLTSGELFMLRTEGIYVLHSSDGAEESMGAFIDFNLGRVDVTYGLPGRLSVLRTNVDDISERNVDKRTSTRSLLTLQRLSKLPFDQVASGPGVPYLWQCIWGWCKRDQVRGDWYMTIEHDGTVHHCLTPSTQKALIRTRTKTLDHGRNIGSWVQIPNNGFRKFDKWVGEVDGKPTEMLLASFINGMVEIWQQRFFFPTLRMEDEEGRAIVASITEQEVGLILKRRELVGAQKAPMLHWVKSHRRSSGSAVRTHMRGATDCTIDGYRVSVLMPGDKDKARSSSAKIKLDVMQKAFEVPVTIEDTTANKLLARLFNSAGVKYERKSDQVKKWKREITAPISFDSLHFIEDGRAA